MTLALGNDSLCGGVSRKQRHNQGKQLSLVINCKSNKSENTPSNFIEGTNLRSELVGLIALKELMMIADCGW